MNPLVAKQLYLIKENIQELHKALVAARAEIADQLEARERLMKEHWSDRKEVATLRRAGSDYDKLEAENERLRARTCTIEEGLRRILIYTKALDEEFR